MGIARLIIAIAIIYLLYRVTRGLIGSISKKAQIRSEENRNQRTDRIGEELVEDPVCHTYVPIGNAVELSENGKLIYFCSRECRDKYRKENL